MLPIDIRKAEKKPTALINETGSGDDSSSQHSSLDEIVFSPWVVDLRDLCYLPGAKHTQPLRHSQLSSFLESYWPAQYDCKWKDILAGPWPEDTGWETLLMAEPRPNRINDRKLYQVLDASGLTYASTAFTYIQLRRLGDVASAIPQPQYEILGSVCVKCGLAASGFKIRDLVAIFQQLSYVPEFEDNAWGIWYFLFQFIGKRIPQNRSLRSRTYLHFHMRTIKLRGWEPEFHYWADPKNPSISLERDKGDCFYADINQQGKATFREARFAIMVRRELDGPYYSVVCLFDDTEVYTRPALLQPVENVDLKTLPAVSTFLAWVEIVFNHACMNWHKVIDHIEDQLSVSFSTVVDTKEREALLFDDEHFSKSKQYFAGLQMLRVCTEWITEAKRNANDVLTGAAVWIDEASPSVSEVFTNESSDDSSESKVESVSQQLQRINAKYKAELDWLLERISTERETIISLRDGLFTATSIREARMGFDVAQESKRLTEQSTELANISTNLAKTNTKMSRLVLIFTVMTIIYLPLGFVTSFFGMNNLEKNWPGVLDHMWPFGVILALTALMTYATAGWGYYHIIIHGEKKGDTMNKNP